MFAITDTGYRAITVDMALAPGETRVETLPASLLTRMMSEQLKVDRSDRLRATDWTQMADAPLSATQKAAWQLYRQQLRDLPTLPGWPIVSWPSPPSMLSEADTVPRVVVG